MEKLTNKKHIAFCQEYLNNGMNATQAYLSVYKSVKKVKVAEAASSRLLSNVKVAHYLSEAQAKAVKKSEITREKIIKRLNERSELVRELQELAKKPKLTEEEKSQFSRLLMVIKTSDANKSDEILNKMLGFNEPDKTEIEHKGITIKYLKPKEDKE